MRLLLSTDTVGGVWDYTATLARALASEGHAVLLAVIGDPTEAQIAELPEEIALESRAGRLEWMLPPASELVATAEWLARLSRGWGAGVAHLNQMAYPGLARFGAPTVVAVHSDTLSWFGEVLHAPPPQEWDGYVDVVRGGLRAADVVVAPSRYQAELTHRHLGRAVDAVIHNGVHPPAGEPTGPRHPRLISVGRAWDDAKGAAVFDRAVAILGDAAPDAVLLGALEGPNGARFTPAAVRAPGRVSSAEVHRALEESTIYVGSSVYEPFGLAPLEAAMRGCALVLSDIGSFRELWEGAADFFPKGSAPGLAQRLRELIEDPDRATALGETARSRALERYTADRFAERYLTLYRNTVPAGAARIDHTPDAPRGPLRR